MRCEQLRAGTEHHPSLITQVSAAGSNGYDFRDWVKRWLSLIGRELELIGEMRTILKVHPDIIRVMAACLRERNLQAGLSSTIRLQQLDTVDTSIIEKI